MATVEVETPTKQSFLVEMAACNPIERTARRNTQLEAPFPTTGTTPVTPSPEAQGPHPCKLLRFGKAGSGPAAAKACPGRSWGAGQAAQTVLAQS